MVWAAVMVVAIITGADKAVMVMGRAAMAVADTTKVEAVAAEWAAATVPTAACNLEPQLRLGFFLTSLSLQKFSKFQKNNIFENR